MESEKSPDYFEIFETECDDFQSSRHEISPKLKFSFKRIFVDVINEIIYIYIYIYIYIIELL